MKIEASEIQRNGFVIYKSRYENTANKYRVLLHDACTKLYDACYLSSPSMFTLSEIVKAMNEEFRDYMKLFISSIDSTFEWSAKRCDYVLAVAKAKDLDADFISLVEMLRDALFCQEALSALSDLAQHSRIRAKDRLYDVVYPRISVFTRVSDSSNVGFENKVFLETTEYTATSNIRVCNTKAIEYRVALEMLGVETSKASKIVELKKPVFTDCLSFDEECVFLDDFISGNIECTGKVKKLLAKAFADENVYSLTKNGVSTVERFCNKVFSACLEERCNAVKEFREKLQQEFKSVYSLYVNGDEVWFGVSQDENVSTKQTLEQIESKMGSEMSFSVPTRLYGAVAIDYESGEPLPMYLSASGMIGEYISDADIFQKGYYADGKPVKVKMLSKSRSGVKERTRIFYSIKDVYYSDERNAYGELVTKSLEAKVGSEISISECSESGLFKLFNVNSKTDLYFCVRQYLAENAKLCFDSTGYLDLVTDLVCAFLYFKSGISVYDFYNIGYGYVDRGMYNAALFDADAYMPVV